MIISRRPFSLIKGSRSSDPIDHLLCNQCEVHLSDEDNDKENEPKFIWPYIYWIIIRCKDICNNSSSEFIWKIVPLEWSEWWFDDIVLQFTAYYNSIATIEPQSIFMDITNDLETRNEGIQSQKLSYIADVCNWFLLPNVLCPWGCS